MQINQLPVKVRVFTVHSHTLGKVTVADLRIHYDCRIPFLPNAKWIEFTVAEHSFDKEALLGGTKIRTWKQALLFFEMMEEKHRPFWIEINQAEIESVKSFEGERRLNPKLIYKLVVDKFHILEWPKMKLRL